MLGKHAGKLTYWADCATKFPISYQYKVLKHHRFVDPVDQNSSNRENQCEFKLFLMPFASSTHYNKQKLGFSGITCSEK